MLAKIVGIEITKTPEVTGTEGTEKTALHGATEPTEDETEKTTIEGC
jgi:hypothetical protein